MKIEEVKRGQRFKVNFGFDVHSAKCIANLPEKKKMIIRVYMWWFIPLTSKTVEYDSYYFEFFEQLN